MSKIFFSESNRRSFLKQPASGSVRPGGSMTLNCTLHNGTGDGEHSIYWFKKESRNSNLGILYVHENSSSECVKSPESPAQCVYSLSKRNVSLSDAGTYYCAVASCGKILYGKGTRVEVGGEHHMLLKQKEKENLNNLSLLFMLSQRNWTVNPLLCCSLWPRLWLCLFS